jgi:CubicO group peptidase (beta-lactamase class C family)
MNKPADAVAILMLLAACSADPLVDSDAANYGHFDKQLFWTYGQKLAGFRNMEKIGPTRLVPASKNPYPLPKHATDLGPVEFTFDGEVMTIDEYVESQKVAGLIVVKDGTIVYERYELGNTKESRWVSYSVTKSVTSMLVGAAIEDGYIDSVDEMITDYVPRLRNSSYDQSRIRDVLQMSSGVAWTEDYADPQTDINLAPWGTLEIFEYLRNKPRVAAPGEVFNYNTAETNLVGDVVRAAVGNNLSTYLAAKIWQPFGMEHDAYWVLTEPGGGEFGGCCLNATLRDYARIGLFAMRGGVLADGSRVLPDNWMAESTSPSKGYGGYGYLWWLFGDGSYAASGIFGQRIHIDPANNVVIALHSVRDEASNPEDGRLLRAAFAALVDATMDTGSAHE